MAKTLQVRFEATILDGLNVIAESSVYGLVDPTASFSDVITSFDTWLADLDACTDGQILSAEIEVLPAMPGGLKSSPTSDSRVEQTGIINFNATGDIHLWAMPIPALSNDSSVLSAGRVVTTEAGPVDTLEDLLTGGGTAALVWTNAAFQALSTAASALVTFRRHNRPLARNTYERA